MTVKERWQDPEVEYLSFSYLGVLFFFFNRGGIWLDKSWAFTIYAFSNNEAISKAMRAMETLLNCNTALKQGYSPMTYFLLPVSGRMILVICISASRCDVTQKVNLLLPSKHIWKK